MFLTINFEAISLLWKADLNEKEVENYKLKEL